MLAIGVPGGDGRAFAELVRHHWALDAWHAAPATTEDATRTRMYRENAARRAARRQSKGLSLRAFIGELQLRVEVLPSRSVA